MRVAVIGGVASTQVLLDRLIDHGFDVAAVFAHAPPVVGDKSGHVDLRPMCEANGIPYHGFRRVSECDAALCELGVDVLFAVGLSQIISGEAIASASLGCVGFHPTALPKGRGRAAVGWLVLEASEGAATFFEIQPGAEVDSGPILAQLKFGIDPALDTAASVARKVLAQMAKALDMWLPELKAGKWDGTPQDHANASYYSARVPTDGFVDWRSDANTIDRLIRASRPPHPGAFAYRGEQSIEIIESKVPPRGLPISGVVGRVVRTEGGEALVQCGRGHLWIRTKESLRVGTQLGSGSPAENYDLHRRVARLEAALEILTEGTMQS